MKSFVFIILALLGIFLVVQSFAIRSVSSIEKHKYNVLKEYDNFEIRQYETALFSSVVIPASNYEETSSRGFRVLAGYIFGGNETGEKIAMTSPVSMEIGDSTKMSFMVPSNYTEENLPKPNNGNIFFEKKEGAIMAAIRFGGWADDATIEEQKNKLSELLTNEGLDHTGKFMYLGYNPPYVVVGRRNEVVVELLNFRN
jgi:hypothetical protein